MAGRWPYSLSVIEHGAFAFCGLLVYVLATRIGKHRRPPSAAMSWVLVMVLLPYIGLPLFLLFGTRKYARRDGVVRAPPEDTAHSGSEIAPAWATQVLSSFDLAPAALNRSVRFHADGGQSWAALLDVIQGAQRSIDLCTYILGDDAIGHAVIAELRTAAARGVRVRLLLDAIGSIRAPRDGLRQLQEAGVTLRWFMPLLHNPLHGRTNLRNHRKLTIADDSVLWSGGRNQAIEYFVDQPGKPSWIDLSFTVDGPIGTQAKAMFEHDWNVASGRNRGLKPPLGEAAERLAVAAEPKDVELKGVELRG